MRTLVTGGAGFIGSHVVRRLLADGDEVVVLDTLDPQAHPDGPPSIPEKVIFHQGDVADTALVDKALEGVDRVVHLASAVAVAQSMYEIARYVQQNSLATALFLERLIAGKPRVKRLVVASSMALYGEGKYRCSEHGELAPPPRSEAQLEARDWANRCPHCDRVLEVLPTDEDTKLSSTSTYAITKRDHEELCLMVGGAYDIPTVALRFFNCYGPGQGLSNPYCGITAIFSSRLLNGRPPLLFEDGTQSRDFIYIDDLVEGIVRSLESEAAVGRAINLGTGRATSITDMSRLLAKGLGSDIEPIINGRFRVGDIRHCFADPTLARELLGFEPRVGLEEGLPKLLEWLQDQDAVDRVDDATDELAAHGLTR